MNRTEKMNIPQVLDACGYLFHTVKGTSMLPFLNEDTDIVRLVPPKGKLKRYDIALYPSQSKDGYVLHRVLKVKKRYYLIAGDNNVFYERIPFDRVIAVAEGYLRDGVYTPFTDPAYLEAIEAYCRTPVHKRTLQKKPFRLTKEQAFLLLLLRAAVCSEPLAKKDFDGNWELLYRLAQHQQLTAMLWPALSQTACPDPIRKNWKMRADMVLRKEILFDAERTAILSTLEKKGIRTVPLKGILLKTLYPHMGMRDFTDNDLLYDTAHRSELLDVMKERGYALESGATHDAFTKKPVFHFEFHKMLFVKKNPLHRFFRDMLKKAVPVSEGRLEHRLTDEDFYLYTVAHASRHHSSGGIGLRFLADHYLMQRAWLDTGKIDPQTLYKRLNAMGLTAFHELCTRCANSIFTNDEMSGDCAELADFFSGGTFGSLKNSVEKKMKEKGRLAYLRDRIFIPFDQMVSIYPFLKKLPILLPFCWLHKVFGVLFTPRKLSHFKNELKILFKRSDDD